MYLGEQLIDPSAARLKLSTQLGVERISIDTRPNRHVIGANGTWDAKKVAAHRQWVESFGLKVEVMALDLGSFLLDSLRAPERAEATAEMLRANIRAAAEGGVGMLKYNLQMVGITRTAFTKGRGGVECTAFRAADYTPERDAKHSYWGVVLPGAGDKKNDSGIPDQDEACGQVMADRIGAISEADGWRACEFLVENLVPTAEACGIRLAGHPQDPAYPPGGLNGVHHVVGSIAGLRRFLDLAPGSKAHGLNFCQGTIAEMAADPTATVVAAIREFGPLGKIFMVHFRNIKGGYLDFEEAFPDEGSVDMAACMRAYREVGFSGMLCPDHVPLSEFDPGRERFFAFALGYTRALMQAA